MSYSRGFSKVAVGAIGVLIGIALSVGTYFVVWGVQSALANDKICGTWIFDTIESSAPVEERAMASLALQGARFDMEADGAGVLSYLGTTVHLSWSRDAENKYRIELSEQISTEEGSPALEMVAQAMVGYIDEYDELLLCNEGSTDGAQSVFHRTSPERVVPNALFTTYDEFKHSVLAEEIASHSATSPDSSAVSEKSEKNESGETSEKD